MTSLHPSSTTLDAGTVQELRESVRGACFAPGDPGYDDARTIWNAMFDDRFPALVVQCAGVADVVRAVQFARSEGLEIAVRGGGHSIPGFSSSDGGIVIDLGPMKGVRVDPRARRATAQAGLQWNELDHETQAFGLATTGGLVSTTGVAGFTLGGGIGHLVRSQGLSCDRLLGADLVTADGRVVRAGMGSDEESELLWALKGGGGNFGIVTSLDFQLAPVGPTVYGGAAFFGPDQLREILVRVRDMMDAGMPEELTLLVNMTTAPPAPFLPEAMHGHPGIAVLACWSGPLEEGEAQLAPIRDLGPGVDLLGPIPYVALQSLLDPLLEKGARNYMKAGYLPELSDAVIDLLAAGHADRPAPQCELHIHTMGGAASRVPADASAFPHRAAPYVVNFMSRWTDPAQDEECLEWGRNVYGSLEEYTTGGAYINFLGEEGPDRVRAAYGEDTYARLAAVKAQYDPDNVFHRNQNVVPA
ncbi:MAG TPA: FAD-binding oxidoreductase [Baekduia sp.]